MPLFTRTIGPLYFFFKGSGDPRDLLSFPTRRSPDLRRLRERVLELWDQVPDAADRLGTDRLAAVRAALAAAINAGDHERALGLARAALAEVDAERSEEHTSELQSQSNLVCRLLLEYT